MTFIKSELQTKETAELKKAVAKELAADDDSEKTIAELFNAITSEHNGRTVYDDDSDDSKKAKKQV